LALPTVFIVCGKDSGKSAPEVPKAAAGKVSTLTSIWSGNHASMVMLRTWVMCVPRERCTPEQFRQR